jgi:hypothetical protein
MVVNMASPTAPPTLRDRLMMPDAFLTRWGSSVAMEICWLPTIASIMPSPRNTCWKANSLNPHSGVRVVECHTAPTEIKSPATMTMRGSKTRTTRAAIGPAKNMVRPMTPMIRPISPADRPPTLPRKSGISRLEPNICRPITKVKSVPTAKLRFANGASEMIGL